MSSLFQERGAAAIRPHASRLASLAALLVCCGPLFVLTLRGWANAVLFVAAAASLFLLFSGSRPAPAMPAQDRRWARALILAFIAPLAALLLSAALRGDHHGSQFDSPSRFLLAIPIFLAVLRHGWPVARIMQWVLPIALVLVLLDLLVQGPRIVHTYTLERITTQAVDPLVFGYLSLTFGLMCLVSIAPQDFRRAPWGVALRVAGVALGLYFSVRSGSRSGWLAAPVVMAIWLHHHWGRGRPLATVGAVVIALLVPLLAYLLIPVVGLRVDYTVREIVEYPWHGVLDRETSIGYRITYLRIAADLFAMHPWAGLGDLSRVQPVPLEAFSYAHPRAVASAFANAFHNQVVSNAVRSGIGGLLATTALMLVPLLVCARGLRRGAPAARRDALMGVTYCTCLLVSSLSTEVVDLKFAASFYAVMTAVFCGAVLGRRGPVGDAPPI
jgi:O-antigen ligase